MGGTDDHSSTASNGSLYRKDERSFGISKESALDEIGNSVATKENMLSDIGLSISCSKMEVNSFNLQQSMMSKTSNFNCSADVKCPKKADKALPCPRCNSLDTKFCYYNNYNVNQPRHFCKGCQRYWTAGGSLRNVAVGAGRRKRKHSSLEPESGTAASSVNCPTLQDCIATASSLSDYKQFSSLNNPNGVLQGKLWTPPVVSSSSVSNNPASEKTQGNLSNEPALVKRTFIPRYDLGLVHYSLDGRKEASNFHEFLKVKSATELSDKYENHCGSLRHLRKLVSPSNIFDGLKDEPKDVSCKLLTAVPSERQASNESGCASSLTTQTISEDACTNGGKSDVDSDASKVGDNCIKKGDVLCKAPELPYHGPCKTAGVVPAVLGSRRHDEAGFSSGISKMHPWKGPVESGEIVAAWTIPPMPFLEGSRPDKPGILWRTPWLPTASAVDAAKASLIPNAGAFQKHQLQSSIDVAFNGETISQKESEKSQPERITTDMRVWVPKTLRLKDADEAVRSSIWATLGIRDKQGPLVLGKSEDTFHHYDKVRIPAVSLQSVNPVAISQSMAFQENV